MPPLTKATKFFKYAGVWRYKIWGEEAVQLVDTRALENILGVVGGPRVVVFRDTGKPTAPKLRIEIHNGFIAGASVAMDDTTPLHEGVQVTEFIVRPLAN